MITNNLQYDEYLKRWQLMRTVVEGDDDTYTGTIIGKETLVDYLPASFRVKDPERFTFYAERAIFTNYTESTIDGMRGLAMRVDAPVYELPPAVEYMIDNWDGGGSDSNQLQKRVFEQILTTGRVGAFVDFPQVEEGQTLEQTQQLEALAAVALYPAESIVDWDEVSAHGQTKLIMVKLAEVEQERNGLFDRAENNYFRVLALDEDGYYYYQLFDDGNNPTTDPIYPVQASGAKWEYIPFFFAGAEDNTPNVDKPPIYSIAKLNLGHYRNSADYEEHLFIHGQPTFILNTGEVQMDTIKEHYANGFEVGSRAGLAGPGWKGELLQAERGSDFPEAMLAKVEQMVQIGADIITDPRYAETAQAFRGKAGQRTSKLGVIVDNVEHLLVNVYEAACLYMGADPSAVDVQLNRDFYDSDLDPQTIAQMIILKDNGIIAKSDIQNKLRKADWIDGERTNEDIDAEAEISDMGVVE